ncbi:Ig-like domain-containing protein [Paenibacillus sp. HWE-109]|uniref:Ig-like domain-containing protein n=1 Tax=Paenibacillus sp. HWE-109 TaxID=1306526 RepID=UPI001EE08D80|nr:Ig-like domain-containing protein [Paenibacillus sp. HWE-109]UKS28761.1 Ig-like domain-containing protein [Paenibacillus sp. HWE-109]
MRKSLLLAIIFLLVVSVVPPLDWLPGAASQAQAANANLVLNGSMELTATAAAGSGWTTKSANSWGVSVLSGTPAITVDNYHGYLSVNAVKVSATAASSATINQSGIPVTGGVTYKLIGAIRSQSLVGIGSASGANIRVIFYNASNSEVGSGQITSDVLKGYKDWVTPIPYEKNLVAPANATNAKIELSFAGTGSVWFDEIQLFPWIPVTGVTLQQPSTRVEAGKTTTVPVLVSPPNASNPTLEWSSSNAQVATVQQGVVTGIAAGTAIITAQTPASAVEPSFSVTYPVTVTSANLLPNGSFEEVTAGTSNGWTNDSANSWQATSSYGSPVVSVSDSVYHDGGHAIRISADTKSSASVATTINVASNQIYRLSAWMNTQNLVGKGASLRINWLNAANAVVSSANVPAVSLTGTQNWVLKEDNVQAPATATKARIYAIYDNSTGLAFFDEIQLLPWTPIASVSLGAANGSLDVGDSPISLSAVFIPAQATDKRLTWSSSNPSVATVVDGKVTAVSRGIAIITATSVDGGVSASYFLNVNAASILENGNMETTDFNYAGSGWNTSKDTKIAKWGAYSPDSLQKPVADWDSNSHSGGKALKITAATSGSMSLNQIKPVVPGQYYKVTGWIKTSQIAGGRGVAIRLTSNTPAYQDTHIFPISYLSGNNDWVQIDEIVQIPASANSARIDLNLDTSTGTAWFDDIKLFPWTPISDLTLPSYSGYAVVGQSLSIPATIAPSNASNPFLTWSTSNPNLVTVTTDAYSTTATVKAIAGGVATVTGATYGNKESVTYVVMAEDPTDITASNAQLQVNQDASLHGTVTAADTGGHTLTYSKIVEPKNGQLFVETGGAWTYYPKENYIGKDRFAVLVSDANGHYATSTIQVTVNAIQHAPTLDPVVIIRNRDLGNQFVGTLLGKDRDNDTLSYTLVQTTSHGSLTLGTSGNYEYIPTAGYYGYDAFIARVDDGHGGTATTTMTIFIGLPGSQIIANLKTSQPNQQHPRLMANADDFARMRDMLTTNPDPTAQEWFAKIQAAADVYVNSTPLLDYKVYQPGNSILPVAQDLLKRIQTLGLTYQLTGQTQYATRAISELEHMENYPNWSGDSNFLSISEMAHTAAIGYDWLYQAMTPAQRTALRQNMMTKIMLPAKKAYIDGTSDWWTRSPSNWNLVVNGGLVTAALAIADEDDTILDDPLLKDATKSVKVVESVLEKGLDSVQIGMSVFATDGAWSEGTAYWDYAAVYFTYMLSSLQTSLGTNYGLLNRPGIPETGNFMANLSSVKGPFNYGDSDYQFIATPELLWLAKHLNTPDISWYRHFAYDKTGQVTPMDLVWYRPGFYSTTAPTNLDNVYRVHDRPGRVDVATFRDSWNDPGAFIAGIKGGINDHNVTGSLHEDLDSGTFILDALGVRWALDLGKGNYADPGYFIIEPDGKTNPLRFDYYRKRAEGQNTLVINPDNQPDQSLTAVSQITNYQTSAPEGGFAIVDTTSAYRDEVVHSQRGLMLFNQRSEFLVQDEVQTKAPWDMYWFMHTNADIDIAPDGKSAILTQNNKRLYAQLLSPTQGTFSQMNAEPLPTSPHPTQDELTNVRKLVVQLTNAGNTTIAIRFVPLVAGQSKPLDTPTVTPLANWQLSTTAHASLSSMTINGQPLSTFTSAKRSYTIDLPYGTSQVPTITAVSSDPSDTVTIIPAAQLTGSTQVQVTHPQGGVLPSTYYISFNVKSKVGLPTDAPQLPITYYQASSIVPEFPPQNTLDQDFNTYWSAKGQQSIQYQLNQPSTVGSVSIAWHRGSERVYTFQIEGSSDGTNWTPLYAGNSGSISGYETYDVIDTNVRFVKIICTGNSASVYNSISEVSVSGN